MDDINKDVNNPADVDSKFIIPELVLQTPVLHDWLSDVVKLSGTLADALGVELNELFNFSF